MFDRSTPHSLERLFERTTEALAVIDSEALEEILGLATAAAAAGAMVLPTSAAEWSRTSSRRWVLAHLLGSTAQRLRILNTIGLAERPFRNFDVVHGINPSKTVSTPACFPPHSLRGKFQ